MIAFDRGSKQRGEDFRQTAHSAKERIMNGSRLDDLVISVNRNEAPRRHNDREINCLWASRIGGRIVGLVHLVGIEQQAVSITLFRVDPEFRHTAILTNLIDRVRDFCCQRGCPAVQLESHVAPQWVLRQFGARGLHLVRHTLACGQDLYDFRLDECWKPAVSPSRPQEVDADPSAFEEFAGDLVAGRA
jgi:hypothetical protein